MRTAPLLVLTALLFPTVARADAPPPGSKWTQAYITESDGTKLHADVLRPANLPANARTPVILSIGPYFNHSGQTGPAGPGAGTPDPPTRAGGPPPAVFCLLHGAPRGGGGETRGGGAPRGGGGG